MPAAKRLALQCKFKEYDTSGDNKLDKAELKQILSLGNPDITDAEVNKLFKQVDRNNDGSIDFDEFVDFIFDMETPLERAPEEVRERFTALFGEEGMDVAAFQKWCSEFKFIDVRLRQNDIDDLFAKVRPRGKKKINVDQFDKLLCHVAVKKGVQPAQVHEQILKKLPFLKGPRPSHVGPANPGELGERLSPGQSAPDRRVTRVRASMVEDGDSADWVPAERVFMTLCRHQGIMDRHEFTRLCDGCSFLDRDFNKADLEIIFSGVMTPQKKIDLDAFKEGLCRIASKKSIPVEVVQTKVGEYVPKTSSASLAVPHESHAQRRSSSRASSVSRTESEDQAILGEEMDWGWVSKAYEAFKEGFGMDNSGFRKLCEQAELFDKDFSKTDAELILSSYSKQKKVTWEQFKDVVRAVARRKQCNIALVQRQIGYTHGPRVQGTRAAAVRLHDDRATWTGTRMGK